MTSTLLFFHLFGTTVILGLFGILMVMKGEEGKTAPTWFLALVAALAITWPLWLTVCLVVFAWTYSAYRIEKWASARKPPSPGGPSPDAQPPP